MVDADLLPLLPTLKALLEEANVTRAAARLGVSQPRMSARLAKLRRLLADPLLVPAARGRGMAPTPRALTLRGSLEEALRSLNDVFVQPEPFDLARSERTFRILANDNAAALVGTALVAHARSTGAADMRFAFLQLDVRGFAEQLERGEADLVLASTGLLASEPALLTRALFQDHLRTAQAKGHPRGAGPLDLDAYCALDHVLVSTEGGGFAGMVDEVLVASGRNRRIAASVQGYLLALTMVERTDLVVTLPDRLLKQWRDRLDVFDAPLDLPTFSFGIAWHPRVQHDPAHGWLRAALTAVSAPHGMASASDRNPGIASILR